MKFLISFFYTFLVFVTIGQAQFQIQGNFTLADFDDLNQELKNNFQPELEDQLLSFKWMLHSFNEPDNFEFRFGIQSNYYDTKTDDVFNPAKNSFNTLNFRSWGFVFGLEYHILEEGNIRIYPSLDYTPLISKLKVVQGIPSDPNIFNASSADSKNYRAIKNIFDVDLNVDFILRGKKESGGISLGLNAGYRYDLNSENWYFEDFLNVDAPKIDLGGLIFGVSLGLFIDDVKPPKIGEKGKERT